MARFPTTAARTQRRDIPRPPPKDLTPAQARKMLEIGNADFLIGRAQGRKAMECWKL